MKTLFFTLVLAIGASSSVFSQDEEAFFIKSIYDYTLAKGQCDNWLAVLSDSIGGRLTGSENAQTAVDYTHHVLNKIPLVDSVWNQACQVPKWIRGDAEEVSIAWGEGQARPIKALSLGNTIGTGPVGIAGEVVEVFGLDTLKLLGERVLKDKVVFFNRAMDPKRLSTSHAYGEAVDQRVHGAARASKYGAKAGTEYPDEIILVGGHLDSWDVGGGAHDDGAGCVHSIQVLETLSALGYKPKRTLRCVMFMNEENGLGGGIAYAKASNEKGEYHLAAIESDSGGFTPRGFTCTAHPDVMKPFLSNLQKFDEFLDPYDLYLKAGGGGADINPLKSQKGLLIGFKPDNSRYFDFHHTAADVFENVNARELRMGAAALTSLVYLIDQRGL